MNQAPRTILVVHPAGLADSILAIPALHALRRHFPAARIDIAAGARAADLLRLGAVADEILPVGRLTRELLSPRIFYRGVKAWRGLTERHDELVVTLHRSTESQLMLKRLHPKSLPGAGENAEVKHRWARGGASLIERLTKALASGRPTPPLHTAQAYLRLLEPLGVRPTLSEPQLSTDHEANERADRLLEKSGWRPGELLVGLHPGAGPRDPRWPVERFISIGSRLINNFQARVMVISGPNERGLARRLVKALPAGRAFAAASPAPLDFASLLARSSLLVAHLSGPAHLAAALGTPVAAIAGWPEPTTHDLLGRRHLHLRGARIDLIAEEDVYDAACRLLKMNRAEAFSWRG